MGKYLVCILIGLAGGSFVAAGLFTLVTTLGIITRLAQITHTANYLHRYENIVAIGSVTGYALWLLQPKLYFQWPGLIVFGLFSGIYIGCLLGGVAEILNAFPVFFRRLNLKQGIGIIIGALAVGKLVGILIMYVFA